MTYQLVIGILLWCVGGCAFGWGWIGLRRGSVNPNAGLAASAVGACVFILGQSLAMQSWVTRSDEQVSESPVQHINIVTTSGCGVYSEEVRCWVSDWGAPEPARNVLTQMKAEDARWRK